MTLNPPNAPIRYQMLIDEFTERKTLQIHLGPRTNWWHRPEAGLHLGEAY